MTALSAYIRKEERSKVNHLSFHLRKLEKKSKLSPKQAEKKSNKKLKQKSMKLKTGNQ